MPGPKDVITTYSLTVTTPASAVAPGSAEWIGEAMEAFGNTVVATAYTTFPEGSTVDYTAEMIGGFTSI